MFPRLMSGGGGGGCGTKLPHSSADIATGIRIGGGVSCQEVFETFKKRIHSEWHDLIGSVVIRSGGT